jgi:hypothetical protein
MINSNTNEIMIVELLFLFSHFLLQNLIQFSLAASLAAISTYNIVRTLLIDINGDDDDAGVNGGNGDNNSAMYIYGLMGIAF